jgi:hypothetical protein
LLVFDVGIAVSHFSRSGRPQPPDCNRVPSAGAPNKQPIMRVARQRNNARGIAMTFDDQNRPVERNPGPQQPGWGIPLAVGAVVIAAAAIIFASAGPDRTRTADVKNQPPAVTTPAPAPAAKAPAETPAPAQPNSPGTQ